MSLSVNAKGDLLAASTVEIPESSVAAVTNEVRSSENHNEAGASKDMSMISASLWLFLPTLVWAALILRSRSSKLGGN